MDTSSQTYTYKLKIPVEVNTNEGMKKVEQLTLRRLQVRDIEIALKDEMAGNISNITIISNAAQQPREVVQAMDVLDYMQLQKGYEDFLGIGLGSVSLM
ncbi:MAG: phage tail assembly protein [Pseudobacteriovorax sp.]|nr:phage tail assembly protein [Pseudobacteriovorax sp.]